MFRSPSCNKNLIPATIPVIGSATTPDMFSATAHASLPSSDPRFILFLISFLVSFLISVPHFLPFLFLFLFLFLILFSSSSTIFSFLLLFSSP